MNYCRKHNKEFSTYCLACDFERRAGSGSRPVAGSPFRELPDSKYRDAVMERAMEIHPNRAKIIDELGGKWAKTGNWKMRKDMVTSATKIRDAAEVVAESEDYDPWQVAETLSELYDEFQTFLVLFQIATGAMPPPHDFGKDNDQAQPPVG